MLIQAPEGKPSMTERATAKGVTEVQVYRLGGNGFGPEDLAITRVVSGAPHL